MRADEFTEFAKSVGIEKAAKEVDVVTTGTFGAMCSSGVFLNFGHADPPIKMKRCWLNEVPAYAGLAAVDVYLGATSPSEDRGIEYGGGHVIEDLVRGKEVHLRAEGYGTDCYPRKSVDTYISLGDINQAILVNPRNAYERYNAATNSTDEILFTYMGTLLPNFGNVTYSGSGQLSPLYKDYGFETIGIGTRIFLGGGIGYVVGEGTQHNPEGRLGTLMVKGDLKDMSPKYLRGATYHRYGSTLYVGVGIPIPIINERVARSAALSDEEIFTDLVDYGVPSRARPVLRKVSYAELKSGEVEVGGKDVPASSLSSYGYALEIAEELKLKIERGEFLLSRPAELLPNERPFKPMRLIEAVPRVRDLMRRDFKTAKAIQSLSEAARIMVDGGVDHLPIVDDLGRLEGIITSWDIAKALAKGENELGRVMTRDVKTAMEDEPIEVVAKRFSKFGISGMPVIDPRGLVVGLITTDDLAKLVRGGYSK
ncbi:MAG: homocysteine biosynthesis protein [Candidatus Bathyarchaeia archaeon]